MILREPFPFTASWSMRVSHAGMTGFPFTPLSPKPSGEDAALAKISILTTSSPMAHVWDALNFNKLHSA